MRLNFFAIYKKKKMKKENKKIQTLQNYIPHFNGRCSHFTVSLSLSLSLSLSFSLSLFLTSCRTSACLLLLHQGPFPPPCQRSVLAGLAAPTVHHPH